MPKIPDARSREEDDDRKLKSRIVAGKNNSHTAVRLSETDLRNMSEAERKAVMGSMSEAERVKSRTVEAEKIARSRMAEAEKLAAMSNMSGAQRMALPDADKVVHTNRMRMPEGNDFQALAARNAQIVAMANPLYERLNHTWERAEEFFKSRGILAPVSLTYSSDEYGENMLGIQRIGGKWRICTGYFHYQHMDDEISWSPIGDCSVEERSQLLAKLPDLFAALVKSNEEVIPRLERAVIEAEHILNFLSGK